MKEARKTGNILIRDKKSAREEPKARNTLQQIDSKKWVTRNENIELQREQIKAQTLSEEEQLQIAKQAKKTASKKFRSTEAKMETEVVSMLEQECAKLGNQLEKQQANSLHLKHEVTQLRKNIDLLNRKLEGVYRDQQSLAKNNDYEQMQKGQLKEQVRKLRSQCRCMEQEFEATKRMLQVRINTLEVQIVSFEQGVQTQNRKWQKVTQEKEELEQELEEKKHECELLREQYDQKKKEWDRLKQENELKSKQNIQKKGEKITRFQVQLQELQLKLKEEEGLRKKMAQKSKEVERELGKKNEHVKDLEEQIIACKKRVNDLSILKSSNNTILNQKMATLAEENSRLRKEVEAKGGVKMQEEKPVLFGPHD